MNESNGSSAQQDTRQPADAAASPVGAGDRVSGQDTQRPDSENDTSLIVGWREWVGLPQLGLPAVKAKVDTGARTSAIHALNVERIKRNGGQDWLQFIVQPIQRDVSIFRQCEAPLVDIRKVTDSGGHAQDRYFISTQLQIGSILRTIEITLSQREDMLFRMLLGRTAMVPNIHVDPSLSFTLGRASARAMYADESVGENS